MIRNNFPAILKDNEETYLSYIEGVVSSIDELATVEATKTHSGYTFRIATSTPEYSQPMLKEVITFHKLIGIHIDISKSIRSSTTIFYEIKIW